nr:hypothetical protein SHINE37_40661 [Rhizobiaceae bacterium]
MAPADRRRLPFSGDFLSHGDTSLPGRGRDARRPLRAVRRHARPGRRRAGGLGGRPLADQRPDEDSRRAAQ